jgi:predicted permease
MLTNLHRGAVAVIILDAVQSVLSLVIMISIGYYLSYKGWFNEDVSKLFSRLVVNIAMPAYMISNLMTSFSKEMLVSSGIALLGPLIAMSVLYIVGMGLSKLLGIKKGRQGTFCSMFAFSNTMFMGLPLSISLFGEKSVPYVLLYYFVNTNLFWIIGAYGIRRDGGDKKGPLFTRETLNKIFPPPLTFFFLVVALILLDVHLPKFIMEPSKYIGNLTTPLSMLFIGISLYRVGLSKLRITRDSIVLVAGRFVIAPLLAFTLLSLLPVSDFTRKVFVTIAAMPVMTQTAIVAETYGADHEYVASMITITTIASLIFIPVYNYLLTLA